MHLSRPVTMQRAQVYPVLLARLGTSIQSPAMENTCRAQPD